MAFFDWKLGRGVPRDCSRCLIGPGKQGFFEFDCVVLFSR